MECPRYDDYVMSVHRLEELLPSDLNFILSRSYSSSLFNTSPKNSTWSAQEVAEDRRLNGLVQVQCLLQKLFSAADFNDSEDLHKHATEYIKATQSHEELVYTMYRKDGPDLYWTNLMIIRNGGFLIAASLFAGGPYADSSKAPDLGMRVGNLPLPTLVIESGWSESLDRLREEARLWLAGGNATAVIVICWRSIANTDQVEGEVELYVLDGNGSPVLRQTEIVFPEPPPEQGRVQSIRLTRWMVLGSTISPDRDPDNLFDLRIDDLRWAVLTREADP
ncbi:hypothetical protein ZTR_05718 [Talaromyces verruculosus]|nr:hypothetical protein ZTR_05718 [Talaromyces verruculosus]